MLASGFHVGSGHAGDHGQPTMVGSFEAEKGTWGMVGLIFNPCSGEARLASATQQDLVSKNKN